MYCYVIFDGNLVQFLCKDLTKSYLGKNHVRNTEDP